MTGSTGDTGGSPAAGGPSVPTCYRHPDRETYIRCARCDRLICPDCMTAAPVGFQCPECIAQGSKDVRTAKTVLGGEIRERGDIITKVLIGINLVVWLGGLAYKSDPTSVYAVYRPGNPLAGMLGLVLGSTGDRVEFGVVDGQWWRLVTAAFLHEQFWHIGLNMFALWVLGSALEPVLGRWRFIALYLISALGGTTLSLLAAGPYGLSYGASGAVFGLMGALFIVMRKLGRETSSVVAILGLNLVLGFVISGIDWRAHIGGLVVGAALASIFSHAPRAHRTTWSVAGCVVMLGIIAVGVAAAVN